MTVERAIEYFRNNNERIRSTAIDENRTSKFMKETIDANNMAIKALEQEPVRCYVKGCAYSDNGICTNDELWIAEEGVCGCFKEAENAENAENADSN